MPADRERFLSGKVVWLWYEASGFPVSRLPDLIKITEGRASQGSVNHLLIFGVDYVCLALQGFDEFPIPTVSQ